MKEYHIGQAIKSRLKEIGMKQQQLAEALEITQTTLSNKLKTDSITIEQLIRISEILRHNFFSDMANMIHVKGIIDYKSQW